MMNFSIKYNFKYVRLYNSETFIDFDREAAIKYDEHDIVYIPCVENWRVLYGNTGFEDIRDEVIENLQWLMQRDYPNIDYNIKYY